MADIQNDEPKLPEQIESDSFKLRRLSAFILVIITAGYIVSHDHNTTLEVIMLALAGFLIGTSIMSVK